MVGQQSTRHRLAALLVACIVLVAPRTSSGQLDFGGGLDGLLGGDKENLVTVSAEFTPATAERPAVLMITADIAPQWHIYPLKLKGGFGLPTKITVDESPQVLLIGSFAAIPEAVAHQKEIAGKQVEVAEHAGQVTWYAPIKLADGVDSSQVVIIGKIDFLVCKDDGQCVPKQLPFTAKLGKGVPIGPLSMDMPPVSAPPPVDAPPLEGPVSTGTFRAKDSEVTWSGWLEPAQVTPGGTTTLYLKAEPAAGWHIYAHADQVPKVGSKPTLIVVTHPAGLENYGPQTRAEIVAEDHSDIGFGVVRHHEGAVTWRIEIRAPDSAALGKHVVSGILAYQACESGDDGSCEIPTGAWFQVPVEVVATNGAAATQPVSFAPATYSDAAKAVSDEPQRSEVPDQSPGQAQLTVGPSYDLSKVTVEHAEGGLVFYLGLAFLGGLVLNLMPCVLPVIGLKVMSFVDQAGHSRSKALKLNLWYAAGIVAVFLILAAVAASSSAFSWGAQSSSTLFNVLLSSLVFAMALSLLGVWEIPIPGFIGNGTVHEMASKEGVVGAFLKGVVTTILAIPCTGPFMATALGWALDKPASTTFQVFAAMGAGMASPYLVVGVYPRLLRFLPKPGMWMETFKQTMGFVLLGTVVFILSYMETPAIVPTVTLLAGIGLACWLYARTPATAEFNDRVQTWALSAAVVAGSALFAFGYLYSQVMVPRFDQRVAMLAAETSQAKVERLKNELGNLANSAEIEQAIVRFEATEAAESTGKWRPFSLQKLGQLVVDEGRTVLVDFSAEWCVTCKTFEQTVLHTKPVDRAIRAGNVATMYADFTDFPPEIQDTIRALRSSGVPVIAVFPGSDPYRPIVFRGAYTQGDIIGAIAKATGRKLDAAKEVLQASAGPLQP